MARAEPGPSWSRSEVLSSGGGFGGRRLLLGLDVAVGVLFEKGLEFLDREIVVDAFDRADLARHALQSLLEKLAFGIGLLGLLLRAIEVAHDLGDGDEIPRIDLGFVFLSPARPH